MKRFLVIEVNVDVIKSNATDYEQNLKETISIYHNVVMHGVEQFSVEKAIVE